MLTEQERIPNDTQHHSAKKLRGPAGRPIARLTHCVLHAALHNEEVPEHRGGRHKRDERSEEVWEVLGPNNPGGSGARASELDPASVRQRVPAPNALDG